MFKLIVIAFSATILFCLSSQSAQAQLFRNRTAFQPNYTYVSPSWSSAPYAAPLSRPSTPRPVTGYGTNLHRNFVIRQEQLRTQRTGIPPRNRGNILWAR